MTVAIPAIEGGVACTGVRNDNRVILNVVKDRLERQNLRTRYYGNIFSAVNHPSGSMLSR